MKLDLGSLSFYFKVWFFLYVFMYLYVFFCMYFEAGCCYIAQAGYELTAHWSLPPESWDYRSTKKLKDMFLW